MTFLIFDTLKSKVVILILLNPLPILLLTATLTIQVHYLVIFFKQAVGAWPLYLSAFSVQRLNTHSLLIPRTKSLQNFPMRKMHRLGLRMCNFFPMTTKKYALLTTSEALATLLHMDTAQPAFMSVLSVAQNPTMPFSLHAVQDHSEFFHFAKPIHLSYPDFTSFIAHCPSFLSKLYILPNVFSRIVTLYLFSAFQSLLSKFNLTSSHPN